MKRYHIMGHFVEEQRKKCSAGGCNEEYYALGFGQSQFEQLTFYVYGQTVPSDSSNP